MRYPGFIKKGDKIAVTAPSFCVTENDDVLRMRNAASKLNEIGYDVTITESVIGDEPVIPAEKRVSEMSSVFSDDSVRYVVSVKGGETQDELLPLLDWDLMKNNPKWIQGYSDNTNILFKYTVDCDIASVYCSNFNDYGMEPWYRSVTENLEFIEGKRQCQESFPYHEVSMGGHGPFGGVREEERTRWISSNGDISFSGRLIGGCMDVLNEFVSTDMADVASFVDRYQDDGIVWYMETYDMSYEAISNMFRSMKDKGWLENVHGFIFGRPLVYSGDYMNDLMKILKKVDVPKVFGADVGHLAPRMTFINGAFADFKINDEKCSLTYRFD